MLFALPKCFLVMQGLVGDNINKNAQFSILPLPQKAEDLPDRTWDSYLVLVFRDAVLTGYLLSNSWHVSCCPCIRESLFGSWQQQSLRGELDMCGLVTFGSAESVCDSFWLVYYPAFWFFLVTVWHYIVANNLCGQSLCHCPLHIRPPMSFNINLSTLAPFSHSLIGEIQ